MPAVAGHLEVLLFELAGHSFGIATTDVVEVLRAVAIEPLPRAPAAVEGVINVRGTLVPVLDVRGRFGLGARALRASDHFIVVRTERVVAIRVERCVAVDIVDMLPHERATNVPAGVSHVRGFALIPTGVVVIHDLRRFLSDTEAIGLNALLESEKGKLAGAMP